MANYTIDPGVAAAIAAFTLPEKLGFGAVTAPVMYSVEWSDGAWRAGHLRPYGMIELAPGARALHYGEFVFEGMKAYRAGQDRPNLFRPWDNCARLARSAERLAMPAVPEALFFEGIDAVVNACTDFVPRRSGQSLYLRPFLYGTEPGYLLRNSNTFRFTVIANPAEAYASGPMRVALERRDIRAASGGVGDVKAAANYAHSLRASSRALARGYHVALWLDAAEHRYLQELSGMNLFFVRAGELHTPALDGAILPGITRDSVIRLARHRGLTVHERAIEADELLTGLADGSVTEVFACGTAAIVNAISVIGDADGRDYAPAIVDGVARELREHLLAIQERRVEDPFGWVRVVPTGDDAAP
jgi:branched-chain amino acid aminotransferase